MVRRARDTKKGVDNPSSVFACIRSRLTYVRVRMDHLFNMTVLKKSANPVAKLILVMTQLCTMLHERNEKCVAGYFFTSKLYYDVIPYMGSSNNLKKEPSSVSQGTFLAERLLYFLTYFQTLTHMSWSGSILQIDA